MKYAISVLLALIACVLVYLKFNQGRTIIIENVPVAEAYEEHLPEANPLVAEIADNIYMLESSRGKNNYSKCAEQGKFNQIGYGIPGNGKYLCFDSHEEQMEVLEKWIEDKMEKRFDIGQIYCYYNSGKATETCPYYQKLDRS